MKKSVTKDEIQAIREIFTNHRTSIDNILIGLKTAKEHLGAHVEPAGLYKFAVSVMESDGDADCREERMLANQLYGEIESKLLRGELIINHENATQLKAQIEGQFLQNSTMGDDRNSADYGFKEDKKNISVSVSIGLNSPKSLSTEKNKAILEFEEYKLINFGSWYTPDVITYLTYLSKQGELLRYVFFDGDLKNQLQSIRMIRNTLDYGITFICKEPGLGQNHFIFGILIENKLIFINPVGETAHKDFYTILSSIKKDYGLEIYLSNTILQRDLGLTAKGIASCGPISVELIRHISSLPKEKILSLLSSPTKAATKTKNGLEYQEISVEALLPESLRALSTVDLANYQSAVEALRKQHLDILTNDPLIADLIPEKQDEFLDENCLNHPIQVAIKHSALGSDSIQASDSIKKYLLQEKVIMTKTLKQKTVVKPAVNAEANSLPNDKKLIQDNALGDDRNLAEHGANPHYWYSVGDGFRLILWLRQEYLNYTDVPIVNDGEEFIATRENNNKIFIADPYYADNFSNYLNDDVNRITATENFASSTPWSHMPATIIIPLLSGLHWRVIRIEVNYQDKTANILFDDPYGAGTFPESLKLTIRPIIKANVEKLIRVQTKEENFVLEDEIPSVEKQLDQQGHGENSWDCGPISFKNIEDYIKHKVGVTAELTYSVPIYTDPQHSKQITEIGVDDIEHYREIIGLPIDQMRLDVIKQQLEGVRKDQCQELSSITLDVSDLSPLQVSMIFAVLENRRLFEARGQAGNYTKEELGYAYQVVLDESIQAAGATTPPKIVKNEAVETSKNVKNSKETSGSKVMDKNEIILVNTESDGRNLASHGTDPHYWYSVEDGMRLLVSIRQEYLGYIGAPKNGEEFMSFTENYSRIFIADPYYAPNFSEALTDDVSRITGTGSFGHLTDVVKWQSMPAVIIIPMVYRNSWQVVKIEINYKKESLDILFSCPYGQGGFNKKLSRLIIDSIKNEGEKLIKKQTNKAKIGTIACTENNEDQQGCEDSSFDCGTIVFSNIKTYIKRIIEQDDKIPRFIPKHTDPQYKEKISLARKVDIDSYAKVTDIAINQEKLKKIKHFLCKDSEQQQEQLKKYSEEQQQKLQSDLKILQIVKTSVEKSITAIDAPDSKIDVLYKHLEEIGEKFSIISHNNKNPSCIRNKHGYINPYNTNNKPNTVGAKIDFITLSYLQHLGSDSMYKQLLIAKPKLLKVSLERLRSKIDFVLSNPENAEKKSEDNEIGLLRTVSTYNHDLESINTLLLMLSSMDNGWYSTLDLNNKFDRYALGYFFVKIGETCNELSDFIKPQQQVKDEENVVRFMFGKLLHFRNKVKNTPAVVFDVSNNELLQMKLTLEQARPLLEKYLDIIGKRVNTDGLSNNPADKVDEINSRYFNAQEFLFPEKAEMKIIQILTRILNIGTDASALHLDNHNVSGIDQKVASTRITIQELQDTITNYAAQTKKIKTPTEQLLEIVNSKEAGILLNLISPIDLNDIPPALDAYRDIIKVLKQTNKQPSNPAKVVNVQAISQKLALYVDKITALFARIDESDKPVNVGLGNESQLLALWTWINTPPTPQEQARIIQQRIDSTQEQKEQAELLLKQLEVLQPKLSPLFFNPPKQVKTCSELSEFDSYVLQVVKETEFLQLVHTQILQERAKPHPDANLLGKLIYAAQMSFGFLGQIHKSLKDNHDEELSKLMIENSVLSDDCYEVIKIRHELLLHNVVGGDLEYSEISEVVSDKIIPWLKDFKYMPICFKEPNVKPDQLISGVIPENSRLISKFDSMSDADKQVFYHYTKIVALNRFLVSAKSIQEYEALKTKFPTITNYELLTEIHWQASLAYRNLGDFKKVIEVLKFALDSAGKIPEESIRDFKVCGVHADIAIAYTQEENNVRAKEHLLEVVQHKNASPYQLIGSNFLLGQIEIAEGDLEIARSRMELTFVKYFDQIITYNPIIAFSLLEGLATLYLDEFDLESAKYCIELSTTIYKEYYPELVSREGQHVVYFTSLLQNTTSRYRLIEAIIKQGQHKQSALAKIYVELEAEKSNRDALVYFKDKKLSNLPLLHTVIFQKSHDSKYADLVKQIHDFTIPDTKALLAQIANLITEIKNQVFQFKLKDLGSGQDSQTIEQIIKRMKHEKDLRQITHKLINLTQALSFQKYLDNDLENASKLLEQSFLYGFLGDFLENSLEQKIAAEGVDAFSGWFQNNNVNNIALKDYLGWRLTNTPEIGEAVIKQWREVKSAGGDFGPLIDQCEQTLMVSFAKDRGEFPTQIKWDTARNLMIVRYFDVDHEGRVGLKERGYSVDNNAIIDQYNSQGAAKFKSKEYEKAIEKLMVALELISEATNYPTDRHAVVLYNIGRAYEEKGNVELAISYYLKAIDLNANHAKAYQYLGNCYFKKVDLPNALRFSKLAIEKDNSLVLANQNIKVIENKRQKGLEIYQLDSMKGISSSFYEYTMKGVNDLLRLRLHSTRLENVVILPDFYIFSRGQPNNMDDLLSAIALNMSNQKNNREVILSTISLNNEHAVGLMFVNQHDGSSSYSIAKGDMYIPYENTLRTTTAYYIDPSNKPIPKGLKEMLQINGYLVEQLPAEQQKYTNCGPEVIENFMLYLTGERLSQEDAIPLHSKLFEEELTNSQEPRIVEIEDKGYTSNEAKENSGTPEVSKEIQVESSNKISNDANSVHTDTTQEFSEILMEEAWPQTKKQLNTEVLVIEQRKEVIDSSQQSSIGQDLLKTSMDEEWEKVKKPNTKEMMVETIDQVWEDIQNSNANELDQWLAMVKQEGEGSKAELESMDTVWSQSQVHSTGSMQKLSTKITDPKEVVKEASILTAQSSDRPIEQQPVELKKSQSHIGQQTQVAPNYEAPKVSTGIGETLWKSAVQCLRMAIYVDRYDLSDVLHSPLFADGCSAPTRASHYSLSPELRDMLSQNQGANRYDATKQPALLSFSNLLDEAQSDGKKNADRFELKPLDTTLSDIPLSTFRSIAGGNTSGESWAQQFVMKEVDLSGEGGVS